MELGLSERGATLLDQVNAFMHSEVFPAESIYAHQRAELIASGQLHSVPPIVEELKSKAQTLGLWNLFLPSLSDGLGAVDYAYLAERMGWSLDIAPEAMNCAAPETWKSSPCLEPPNKNKRGLNHSPKGGFVQHLL